MSEAVPVAEVETPPIWRLMTLGVPLFLVASVFVDDVDLPGIGWHWVVAGVLLLLVLVFELAPRRLSYCLEEDALVVTRLTGRTALPYAGITARRSAGRLGVRLFGTGMPGYLTGLFSFGPDAAPRVQAAASRGTDGVLIEHGDTTFFLTPADPGAFLRALAARGVRVDA